MAILDLDTVYDEMDENGSFYAGDYATLPQPDGSMSFEVWFIDLATHDEDDPRAELRLKTNDERAAAEESDRINADLIARGVLSSAVADLEQRERDPFAALLRQLGLM